MPYDVDIGDGATALDQNQLTDALDGTYWVSGWDATLGTGDLEVDIAPGEGAINGGDVSTGAVQTVDFTGDVDGTNPRKAVISVDDTGTVQKTLGTPVSAEPIDEVRFRTYDPQPPTNAPGVVVAEVWLAAGATVLESADIRDRRVANDVAANPTSVLGWQEDANSPFTFDENSGFQQLAGSYDIIQLHVEYNDTANAGENACLIRVNGDTGNNYFERRVDGTSNTDEPYVRLAIVASGDSLSATFECTGRWATEWAYYDGPGPTTTASVASAGHNATVTSPLDSFKLEDFRDSFTATVEVYGKDIQ